MLCTCLLVVVHLMSSGNNRPYAPNTNLQILPTGFYLSIYDLFLTQDIKGLNVRIYFSLVVSTRSF